MCFINALSIRLILVNGIIICLNQFFSFFMLTALAPKQIDPIFSLILSPVKLFKGR